MKISYRNTKNVDIFSSLLMTKHTEIKILPSLYWIPSTVLMLSPHCTDVIPLHVLMLSPQCTEYPPQYWSYPPLSWCYPPTVLNNLHSTEGIPHSTEAIPHMYCCYPPTVLKVSLHSTEYPPQHWCYSSSVLMLSPHVLMLSPYCTEQPPQYWSYPPQYWCYPPTVLMLPTHSTVVTPPPPQYCCYAPHSTVVIPPLYWATSTVLKLSPHPRGCTHQDYIRGSPSEKMEKTPKVSNYFAYYPKVSSSLMERTQKYHRIVKRQKWFTEIPICTTIYNFASHQSPAKLILNVHQLSSDNDLSKYLLIPQIWKSQCIKEILRKNSIQVW